MKKVLYCVAAFAAFGAGCCATAHAASFSGGLTNIVDFANGTDVSTAGTLVDAVNLLNANVGGIGVSTTINGVLFKGTQPGSYFEGAESFANASFVYHGGEGYADGGLWSSGGAFDTLADSQIYNIDNGNISYGDGFGVCNLIPGQRYELQVFMLDDRAGVSKTFPLEFHQTQFDGVLDHTVTTDPNSIGYISGITIGGNGTTHADGEVATVRFSIDAPYNGIFVNSWDGGAINGMQLRLIPEPASIALAGIACAVLVARKRRK